MAIPARLSTTFLTQTQQSNVGASTSRREHKNAAGTSSYNGNALLRNPTPTSLLRLGPELPVRLYTADMVADTTLLSPPLHSVSICKAEKPACVTGDCAWEQTRSGDGCSTNSEPILAVAATSAADALSTSAVATWTLAFSDEPPDPPGTVAGPRKPQPQLQSPPRPGTRSSAGSQRVPPAEALPPSNLPHSNTSCPKFELSLRSPQQQHFPSSQPSTSAPAIVIRAGSFAGGRTHGHAGGRAAPTSPSYRRLDGLLDKVLAATDWYEFRALLISNGGADLAGSALDTSPSAFLTVLRRLVAITAYDMRPAECAQLGGFLEHWLQQHTGVLRLMSPVELSLCLHSLAKLARALPAPPATWTAAWFSAAQPYLLQYSFRPKDLSLSVWALSRLQLQLPPVAIQLLLAAAEPHLPHFNSHDLSLMAIALSVLQARAGSSGGSGGGGDDTAVAPPLLPSAAWQTVFLQRCSAVLPEFTPQGLANLLHGIVRSGMAVPYKLYDDLCAALYSKLPECNPQALANTLSAFAAVGYVPDERWLERFSVESAGRMAGGTSDGDGGLAIRAGRGGGGVCNLDDITHLALAAVQLRLVMPRWWVSRFYASLEHLLPQGSPRQLAQALLAVAQMYRTMISSVTEERDLPPPPPRSLFLTWHRSAAAALPGFNAIDAAHSLWALAVLGNRPPTDWLERLLVTCRSHLAAAPPGDVALLTWSLAALRFRPTWSWSADALEAVQTSMGQMNGQDFAMLTSSLVRLSCRPRPSWSTALLETLKHRLSHLDDRCLSQTSWAMYRLRVQPTPVWLVALAEELQRRWQRLAKEAAAGGGGGGGGGGKSGGKGGHREALRHVVMLLWVVSMWIGTQRSVRGRAGELREVAGGGGHPAAAATEALGIAPRDVKEGDAATAAGGSGSLGVHTARQLLDADGEVSRRPYLRYRVTARMLRRRRKPRPDHLVAALGGDLQAATALRGRISTMLLGPAMDVTEAGLAVGICTPQDMALLLEVAGRLPLAARQAAAARPTWRQAVLAAVAVQLPYFSPLGLLKAFCGLAALGVPLEADGAATAAATAAAVHISTPLAPAAYKVTLLWRLCQLRVVRAKPSLESLSEGAHRRQRRRRRRSSRRQQGGSTASSPWGVVLTAGLLALSQSSKAAAPLLRLEVEVLKARLRLRKLAGDSLAGGGQQAAAVASARQRLVAAREAGFGEAAARGYGAAGALAALTADVRTVVTAAAASARVPHEDEDDSHRRRRPCSRVPPLGEDQRHWIWRRARRTITAATADASPILVVKLVQMVSQHASELLAASYAGSNATVPGGSGTDTAKSPQPCTASYETPVLCALLWLAAATRRCWRGMLPGHRVLVKKAWRQVLAAPQVSGPSSSCCRQRQRQLGNGKCDGGEGISCSGGDSNGGGDSRGASLSSQLLAQLPASMSRRRHQREVKKDVGV